MNSPSSLSTPLIPRITVGRFIGGWNVYVAMGVLLAGLSLMLGWDRISAWAMSRPSSDRLLLLASAHGDSAAAEQALLEGASANAQTEAGFTTLYFAAAADDLALVRALIDRGADPGVATAAGWTPLAAAAMSGASADLIEVLIKAGSDPNVVAADIELTPLYLAAKYGHEEIVEVLVDAGARVNHRTKYGESALMAAILNDEASPSLVRTLINAGIDIHAADEDGVTPLQAALSAGRYDVGAILMESASARE